MDETTALPLVPQQLIDETTAFPLAPQPPDDAHAITTSLAVDNVPMRAGSTVIIQVSSAIITNMNYMHG